MPVLRLLAHGLPDQGLQAQGLQAHGLPAQELQAHGLPAKGLPAQGVKPSRYRRISLVGELIRSVPAWFSALSFIPGLIP